MRRLLLLIGLFGAMLVCTAARAQTSEKRFARGYAVVADGPDHLYVSGGFTGGLGWGDSTFATEASGAFLARVRDDGALDWMRLFPGSHDFDYISALVTDGAGNVYAAGGFNDSVQVAPEAPLFAGDFVVKYNRDGVFQWIHRVGDQYFSVTDLALHEDILYVTGNACGFECYRLFVAKLDVEGNQIWMRVEEEGSMSAGGIAVDAEGNAYVSGIARGSARFGDISLPNTEGPDLYFDVFFGSVDANGTPRWAFRAETGGLSLGGSVAVNAHGTSYFTGVFSDSIRFSPSVMLRSEPASEPGSPGPETGFLAKVDPAGTVRWARRLDAPNASNGQAVQLDAGGTIHVAGISRTLDVFFAKDGIFVEGYDAGGARRYAFHLWDAFVMPHLGRFLALGPAGALYVAGVASEPVEAPGLTVLSGEREGDVFLGKLDLAGIVSRAPTPDVPAAFALRGNYPNPFNPATTLVMDLPASAEVTVAVYDVLGRRVLTVPGRKVEAGAARQLRIDGSALTSGTYVYRVRAENVAGQTWHATGRFVLVK